MTKYLLRFNKNGNMRFLSHLDLGRLFRRAIKKAEITVVFSDGFNPHEKINIVQPLSLGFESDSEYFEITTKTDYPELKLMSLLNDSMPIGISFYDCRIVDLKLGNLSNLCYAASYDAIVPLDEESYTKLNIEGFINRSEVLIKKRDKKTKTMVDKDVKSMIFGLREVSYEDGLLNLNLLVSCATNISLNPANLLTALFEFSNISYEPDKALIIRKDLLFKNGEYLSSLFDC